MKALIHVTLKPSVLDPQGEAIKKAVHSLGMKEVQDVRIGKYIEMEIDENEKTKSKLEDICKDLLSNPVIENYKINF
ncbi:MAG: phosphoribosylformylglycinamidine synthase subunit PurS [Verrucomicrobiota bacterium]